jgi:hypothetical protein
MMSDQPGSEPDAAPGADDEGAGSESAAPQAAWPEPAWHEAPWPEAAWPEAPWPEPPRAEPPRPERKRLRNALGKAAERSPRVGMMAQRAQQTAREGLATARDAARPRLAQVRDGLQQRIADNPEVADKVARSLAIALAQAVAHSAHAGPMTQKAAPAIGDHLSQQASRTVARLLAKGQLDGTPAGGADVPAVAEDVPAGGQDAPAAGGGALAVAKTAPAAGNGAAAVGEDAPAAGGGALAVGEDVPAVGEDVPAEGPEAGRPLVLAGAGEWPPPDPAALYRDGPGELELIFPLPEELASLPWASLSRRNRFHVLVAAWARREADGIALLRSGLADQASEAFQECLIGAQQLQAPELVARSYQDLAELATATGDEDAARRWHEAAAHA